MKNKMVAVEWRRIKEELKENIDKTIERGVVDTETLKIMMNILDNSKLKLIEKEK